MVLHIINIASAVVVVGLAIGYLHIFIIIRALLLFINIYLLIILCSSSRARVTFFIIFFSLVIVCCVVPLLFLFFLGGGKGFCAVVSRVISTSFCIVVVHVCASTHIS